MTYNFRKCRSWLSGLKAASKLPWKNSKVSTTWIVPESFLHRLYPFKVFPSNGISYWWSLFGKWTGSLSHFLNVLILAGIAILFFHAKQEYLVWTGEPMAFEMTATPAQKNIVYLVTLVQWTWLLTISLICARTQWQWCFSSLHLLNCGFRESLCLASKADRRIGSSRGSSICSTLLPNRNSSPPYTPGTLPMPPSSYLSTARAPSVALM